MTSTGSDPDRAPARSSARASGDSSSRLRGSAFLLGFAVTIAVVLLAAAATAALSAPPEPPPECEPGTQCGGPPPVESEPPGPPAPSPVAPSPVAPSPVAPSPVAPSPGPVGLRAGTPWLSTELAYEFEYAQSTWVIEREDGRGVTLVASYPARFVVHGVPANETGLQALFDARLDELRGDIPDLAPDPRARNTILGPAIGYLDGIGGTFAGSVTNAQGGTTPVGVSLVAASDGRTTVVMTLIVDNPETTRGRIWQQQAVRSSVRLVFKTFRWEVP